LFSFAIVKALNVAHLHSSQWTFRWCHSAATAAQGSGQTH